MPAESETIATLKQSKKPKDLARAAQTLAASAQSDDHRTLLEFLRTSTFWERIDPPNEVNTGPEDLWLARPIRTLAANPAPSARAVLVELMGDDGFTAEPDRVDLLVIASASIRPPAPQVVEFWRKYAGPDGVHLHGVVSALLDNGEPAAVAEFERILLSTGRDEDGEDPRLGWLRGAMLKHRDNPHVLAMAERLVMKPQPPHWTKAMQTAMAEAVFLHKSSWYRPHQVVLPPPRLSTPTEGRKTLRRIAEYVRNNLQPSPALEAGIAATLVEIDAIHDAD